MNGIPITDLSKLARKIIDNINFVLFITIIAGALIGCLFALVDIVYMSYDTVNTSTNMSDQMVINRLNTYETSQTNNNYKVISSSITNPFVE